MKVYIAATRQNDGKTIACLGLISALKRRVGKVGYIKPVGQRYIEIDGAKIDEDALLIKKVYDLEGKLKDMSPVAIPRHFTENYIDAPDRGSLVAAVTGSFARIESGKDVVVVEGTGHAGVGSVIDMSNGDAASLLGCAVVIISSGGMKVLGAIINKVDEPKFDKIRSYVRRGLERKGIELLGVMPFRPVLSSPTMEQLFEDIDGELLSGRCGLGNVVEKMVVGAMPPHQALDYLTPGALLITPGTRDDLILAAMSSCLLQPSGSPCVAGMILTGGTPPQQSTMQLVEKTGIPVMLVEQDTFTVASRIATVTTKLNPGDTDKIRAAEQMVDEFVDVERIIERLRE
jgi:BioD-like phosphotransacetylase family protein